MPWIGHHPARRLLDQTSGLPTIGWEASCKFSPAGIDSGRLLVAFKRSSLSLSRWERLIGDFAMPEPLKTLFLEQLPQSVRLGLGYEQGSVSSVAKAYLEFETANRASMAPSLSIVGYKWPISARGNPDNRPIRVTEYSILNGMKTSWLIQMLRNAAMSEDIAPVYDLLADLLEQTGYRVGNQSPTIMSVREEGFLRSSYALDFRGADLSAEALRNPILVLAQAWALDLIEVDQLFNAIGHRQISWLAAGVSSTGLPVFTLYCVADQIDAVQACYASDASLNHGARFSVVAV
jgi:hypothetical protein